MIKSLTSPNSILYRANQNANSPLDIDKNKFVYELVYRDIKVELAGPIPELFEQFRYRLLYDSELRKLEPKYYQRPDRLSFDEYGTEALDWILMLVNNVCCYEDFVLPEVYIPSYNAILEVTNYVIPEKFRRRQVKLEE